MNQLNDNKAGMEGLDKAKINEVIRQSTGARYQSYLDRKHARLQAQIDRQMQSVNALTREQKILNEQKLQYQCAELEHERDLTRTHVHIDMDAFYAAVEMRDAPTLRHVPMAVGGMQMLSTSNYLARAFGVRAAMPGFVARRLCPQLVIVPTNFHKYTDISRKIKQIMLDYDQGLSMGSLDEAYLDISDYLYVRKGKNVTLEQRHYSGDCICWLPRLNQIDAEQDTASTTIESECSKCHKTCVVHTNEMNFGDTADEIVREIRFRIEQRTGLTASAGIAPNSMLAKIASDKNKPNGQCRVENTIEAVNEFMKNLPVRKVSGVGSVLESQLKALDVHVCGDIQKRLAVLPAAFSDITIDSLMRISTGVGWSTQTHDDDETSVNHRKSVSVERTFTNESDPNELLNICEQLCESLAEDVKEKQLVVRWLGYCE